MGTDQDIFFFFFSLYISKFVSCSYASMHGRKLVIMLWYGCLDLPRVSYESKLLAGIATHIYHIYIYI